MQHLIEQLTTPLNGESLVSLAHRSGVNRSTIHRIARGETDPTLSTLRELAIAHGLDLDISLRPLSTPAAAAAARYLLDETMAGYLLSPDEKQWVGRLAPLGDPVEITTAGGRASAPAHRPGAVLLRGDRNALRLASAGTSAGGAWVVSGRAAFDHMEGTEGAEGAASQSGPSILWAEDPVKAARMLADTHTPVSAPANAQVVVAAATSAILVDSWLDGAVRFASPMQVLLDCIGLGGELEHEAIETSRRWSGQ